MPCGAAWTGKRILVCGGNGFIGRHLVERLRRIGDTVMVASRSAHGPGQITLDLSNRSSVDSVLSACPFDAVYNCAGIIDQSIATDQYTRMVQQLLTPAINLAESMQVLQPGVRLIHLGTNAEYGNAPVPHGLETVCTPNSAYGAIKLAITQCLQAKARSEGFNVVVVRPFFVYGSGAPASNFLNILLSAAKEGNEFKTSPGEQTRDLIHVDRVVDMLILALDASIQKGVVLNACTGVEISVKSLLQIVKRAYRDFRPNIGAIPYRATEIMRSAGCLDIKMNRQLAINELKKFIRFGR